jgi:hypothetical protein
VQEVAVLQPVFAITDPYQRPRHRSSVWSRESVGGLFPFLSVKTKATVAVGCDTIPDHMKGNKFYRKNKSVFGTANPVVAASNLQD